VLLCSSAATSRWLRALAEGFAQGPDGYARDTVLAMSRWPFDLAGIIVPVDLWYGEQDTSTVHSPDLGASLVRRIPAARLHVLPDAGGALLWTHAGVVLRSLLERTIGGGCSQ
jgi:pimeloyl-ACP methyl ester carboxylesterase